MSFTIHPYPSEGRLVGGPESAKESNPTTPMDEAMRDLHTALNRLEADVDLLVSRLSPVLQPETVQTGKVEDRRPDAPPPNVAPLLAVIGEARRRVVIACNHLENASTRLVL